MDLFADTNTLYRNNGGGSFTRIVDSGLGDGQIANPGFSMAGNTWGDYDNDGDLDAFIAGQASFLYQNNGDGTFTQITDGVIGGGTANRGWTCAWSDYDNDGNLDLAIVHPAGFVPGGPPLPNMLFRNDGPPNYTFTQVLDEPIVTGLDSYTVGTWSDYDCDGDSDYFVGSGPANGSTQPDNIYRNLLTETGTATFERIMESAIADDLQDGQVWNWIDYDNDGDLDAYVTNWAGGVGGLENRLYRRNSDDTFTSITDQPLTTDGEPSLSSNWGDFDNDGDLDCYVSNDANPDRVYENMGDGNFIRRTDTPITAIPGARRGATLGDYDDDGDLDLLANGASNRRLYRNDTDAGNYLQFRLYGPTNKSAIGAKVRLLAQIDGESVWQLRELSAQNAFNGHNSQRLHFGLGDATVADTVLVEWPGGDSTTLTGLAVNRVVLVGEVPADVSEGVPGDEALSDSFQVTAHPNPFVGHTRIGFTLPNLENVTISIHDTEGRRIRVLQHQPSRTGPQEITWDGTDSRKEGLPGGIYFYRFQQAQHSETGTVTLVR